MVFSSQDKTSSSDRPEVVVTDETSGRQANIIQRSDGNNAVCTDATVTVEQLFGRDPLPDTFFTILTTGATNDTWTITIAATTNDSTTPDRDLPQYQKVFTVQAGEVGDEIKLAERMVSELNADSTFEDTCYLKAQRVGGDTRAIVHISSTEFSMSGEFAERPNAGDFTVAVTGTATVNVGFDNLIARGKATSLARDPNNPHRLGILGISGSVTVTPGGISESFEEYLENGTHGKDMNQDGSSTPISYTLLADSTGEEDYYVQNISIHGQDNGIKYLTNFLARSVLTNGITTTITSDGTTITRQTIKKTEDMKHEWTKGLVINYSLEFAPGTDDLVATAVFDPPFPLIAGSSDKIEMVVNDDLTSISSLNVFVTGFKREA